METIKEVVKFGLQVQRVTHDGKFRDQVWKGVAGVEKFDTYPNVEAAEIDIKKHFDFIGINKFSRRVVDQYGQIFIDYSLTDTVFMQITIYKIYE